ncbi:MAG TPA: right-handed parallel beta-helix repeat-containing protein [Chitinophagaceae bacterium]|nr:right-handed parallel beta-helix repeat-containing protein [Chitinophagaceae bacterium]
MKNLLLLLLPVLFISFSAFPQKKYYFRHTDKNVDEGTGSKEHPFISLGAFSKIKLRPGDTVFFWGGNIFNGTIGLSDIHGDPHKPIVFTSYGKGKAEIHSGDGEAFVITGSSHFLISDLIMVGFGRKGGNRTDGVKLVSSKSIKLGNLEIAGFQKAGLQLFNCRDAEINGVVAQDNGMAGILVEGDYQKRLSEKIHIVNCRADNNPGDPTNLTNHSGNGILVGNSRNVLIEYCTATNNGWDMPRIGNGPVGIWAYEADSLIIQHCVSYRNKTAPGAADGGGFDLDGGVTNSIIQYCLSYENEGAGYGIFEYNGAGKWKNNTVRYCISINDGRKTEHASGMYIWNGWGIDSMFTDFYAYNNFFYNDSKYAFSFASEAQHKRFYFFNNVFVSSDSSDIYNGIDSSATDVFLGNVWMRKSGGFRQNAFSNLEQWAKATGYEMKDNKFYGIAFDKMIFDLPKYTDITDPYRFKTNPMLRTVCNNKLWNKGLDLKKMFGIDPGKKDFFGNPVPNGTPEPGVFEMQ